MNVKTQCWASRRRLHHDLEYTNMMDLRPQARYFQKPYLAGLSLIDRPLIFEVGSCLRLQERHLAGRRRVWGVTLFRV